MPQDVTGPPGPSYQSQAALGGLAATEPWLAEAIRRYPVPSQAARARDPDSLRYLTEVMRGPWPEDMWAALQQTWTDEGQQFVEEVVGLYGCFWHWRAFDRLPVRLPHLYEALLEVVNTWAPVHYPSQVRTYLPVNIERQVMGPALFRLASERMGVLRPRGGRVCPLCGAQFHERTLVTVVGGLPGMRYCHGCSHRALVAAADNWVSGLREGAQPSTREERATAMRRLVAELGAIPDVQVVSARGTGTRRLAALPVDESRRDRIVAALAAVPSVTELYADYGQPWPEVLRGLGLIGDTWRPARGTYCQATDGQWMRSLPEKAVDDYLTSRGITHTHEPSWPQHPELNPRGRMRADWRLHDGTMVEYAGMLTENTYRTKMQVKTQLAHELGVQLIILTPDDLYSLPARFADVAPDAAGRPPAEDAGVGAVTVPGRPPVSFALDGQDYEVDLAPWEEMEFRVMFARYTTAGRRTGRR